MREIVEVIQVVLVECIKKRIADQMVDIPVASDHGGNCGSHEGGGEVHRNECDNGSTSNLWRKRLKLFSFRFVLIHRDSREVRWQGRSFDQDQ